MSSFYFKAIYIQRNTLIFFVQAPTEGLKQQLHNVIYRLRFYSNSLIHILSLSNLHNNVASIQKNQSDKSHRVIVALLGPRCNKTTT